MHTIRSGSARVAGRGLGTVREAVRLGRRASLALAVTLSAAPLCAQPGDSLAKAIGKALVEERLVGATWSLVSPARWSAHRLDRCYPACMVALGAHYLPFVFLYGMRLFGLLAVGLVALGLAMSQRSARGWADPAWIMGAVLLLFSAAGWIVVRREGRAAAV